MSYATIHACATDTAFTNRLTSCCAQEAVPPDPASAAMNLRYDVASKPDIEAAYASALAGGNPNPGGDESVITDGMILSAVQSLDTTP